MNFLLKHLRVIAVVLVVSLGLALFAILRLEAEQRRELAEVTEFSVEDRLWSVYQLGNEYRFLREAALKLRYTRSSEDLRELSRRQDIFVGRIELLRDPAFATLYGKDSDIDSHLQRLARQSTAIDGLIASMARRPVAEQVQKAIFLQEGEVNFITRAARDQFAQRNAERKQRIVELGQTRIVLSLVQFALLALFSAFMFWALWRLEKRQQDQVRMAGQLNEALQRAEQASEAKSRFLAHVSHEIRTPLTAILGYGQRLREISGLAPRQQQWLERIAASGEYLQALLNNVLELSRIEVGKAELQLGTLSMVQLMQQLDALFREQAQQKGLYFELRVDPGVDDVLQLDAGKLRQILVNLIGNAIKMTHSGGISINFWQTLDAGKNVWLHASVRDTGPGIPPEAAGRIFRPFEQSLDGKRAGGSGLGLAISREFAELMGGTLHFDSKLGSGSSFFLQIPVQHSAGEATAAAAVRPSSLAGLHVLIVDDQEMNLDLLQDLLEQAGASVVCQADGPGALAIMQLDEGFDAVVLDYHMPLMNGLQLARAIRARGYAGCILLSTAGILPEVADMMAAGIDGSITKPFHREQLLSALAHLPARKLPAAAAAAQSPSGEDVFAQLSGTPALWALTPAANALGFAPARFLGVVERGLQRVHELLAQWPQEPAERRRQAHSAKGIAGQIGALPLQHACAALEAQPEAEVLHRQCLQVLADTEAAWPAARDAWRNGD
ncbi:ATP-binding protein [Chitinilyticum litopenaei]|uniref:ATP-binding protein n=1 Tax=Chitinilyticum litopenaei TaxID=1121276 RepID=UPI00041EDF8E|nr:ATP-binding protein [Chitinilyticum litopenaei]